MKTKEKYLFSNRALIALIVPLIIEQLLAILVGMIDSIMIASVGEAAVSGVSLVDQVMVLMTQMFSALATGGAVVTGQYLGQKRLDGAKKSATQMVWFVTICAFVLTAILYVCKYWILHGVFGQIDADVMRHADIYFMIVTISVPFMALYNCGAAIFRVMGNSKMPMRISILMNLINIAGNAILIFGFHRGTEGVAIPTLISRVVGAVLVVSLLCGEKNLVSIERSFRYHFDWTMVKRILEIGVPNGLETSMFQLGKILVLSIVSTFGTYAIAANAVGNAVTLFSILPGLSICLAITTVVSQCVGLGDYEQVRYYTKKLILFTHIGFLITIGIVFLTLPLIIRAYQLSDTTAQVTRQIIYFHGICTIFLWPISFSLPTTFRAAGDERKCMVISIISMWIFRIGFSYLLGIYLHMGVFGVWVAMIIDWVFRGICFGIRYMGTKWQRAAIV